MKNYGKDNKSSCIMYLDVNNLYGRAMPQVLNGINMPKFKRRKCV